MLFNEASCHTFSLTSIHITIMSFEVRGLNIYEGNCMYTGGKWFKDAIECSSKHFENFEYCLDGFISSAFLTVLPCSN